MCFKDREYYDSFLASDLPKASSNSQKTKSDFNEIDILEDTKMSLFHTFSEMPRYYVDFTDSDGGRAWVC